MCLDWLVIYVENWICFIVWSALFCIFADCLQEAAIQMTLWTIGAAESVETEGEAIGVATRDIAEEEEGEPDHAQPRLRGKKFDFA